jgi:hypothetical protein
MAFDFEGIEGNIEDPFYASTDGILPGEESI